MELSNPPGGRRPVWKKTLIGVGLVVFTIGCMAFGAGLYLAQKFAGRRGFHPLEAMGNVKHYADVAFNPAQTFPGRHRINLLCLGLDRNWTRKDMPYTKGARSDTMMVASLDLDRRAVSVLSVPRDTWVELPGTHRHAKINDAYARGGAPYAIQTAEKFLGAKVDYYVVIKQEAIQGAIDQLGGIEVPVEKKMDYDDNWGHLHVHLKPGQQRLTGEQTVGYMRFRHDAEGDFGRIRRQHQVVNLLTQRMKDPTVVFRLGELFDVLNEHVKTNLAREQILALGQMFHHLDADNLVTASLPGTAVTRSDISYVEPDEKKKELMVQWLLLGHEEAANGLINVELVNGSGDSKLAQQAAIYLRNLGFHVRSGGSRSAGEPRQATEAIEHSQLARCGRRVLAALNVPGQVVKEPARAGGADVTLLLGKDAAANPSLAAADEPDSMATTSHGGRASSRATD